MATPILGYALFATGSAIGTWASQQLGQHANNLAVGTQRATIYSGNRLLPNESMPLDAYIVNWRFAQTSTASLISQARDLGFNIGQLTDDMRYLTVMAADGTLARKTAQDDWELRQAEWTIALNVPTPAPGEMLEMLNRGLITEDLAYHSLRKEFGGDPQWANQFLKLRHQIPGPSDLVSFAVREAFDPALIVKFEYNKEIPNDIIPWMQKQGFGGVVAPTLPPGSTDNSGAILNRPTYWFDMYWFAHWQLPAIGQGYEMFHRLYSTSDYGPSPDTAGGIFFEQADLEMLQKANDYPQYWRKRLQAISFNPLTRVDVRRMFNEGVVNESEVYHCYRAIGYTDENAKRLLAFVIALKEKADRKAIKLETVNVIYDMYDNDVIDRELAISRLKEIGYDDLDSRQMILHHEYWKQKSYFVLYKKEIKKAFLRGLINTSEAQTALVNLGLKGTNTDKDIELWKSMLFAGGKHLSGEKMINFYVKGFVSINELLIRLTNLGYTQGEIGLLVKDADTTITQNNAAKLAKLTKEQQTAADKLAKEQAKQLALQQKALQKQQDEIEKEMLDAESRRRSAFSEKNIIAFAKAGYLDQASVETILAKKGWDAETIADWIGTYLSEQGTGA